MIFAILVTQWHGGLVEPLSSLQPPASARAQIVFVPQTKAQSESMKLRQLTRATFTAAAAILMASGAQAQSEGYAHFGATSDTIRIQGNTVFPTVDCTYEMRIRIQPGSPIGRVTDEQRDTYEDKVVIVSSTTIGLYLTRGQACSTESLAALAPGTTGVWRHVAWVRSGETVMPFIDGLLTNSWAVTAMCVGNSPDSRMSIGSFKHQLAFPVFPSFLGDLDWIHVSAGARYTASFTPPYECEITADADTQLLLKFNEPAGTTTLYDESWSHYQCDVGYMYPPYTGTSPTLGNTIDGYPACVVLCDSDIDGDGNTDGIDLAIILTHWGSTAPKAYPRADTNADGMLNGADLTIVLNGWGACP